MRSSSNLAQFEKNIKVRPEFFSLRVLLMLANGKIHCVLQGAAKAQEVVKVIW